MLMRVSLDSLCLLHSVYKYIDSNMYVLFAEKEALIIDPHKHDELTELIRLKGIEKVTILLTHEHHDHTTGVYWYQEHFDCTLICQQNAAEFMSRKQYLRPTLIAFMLGEEDHNNGTNVYEEFKRSFVPRQYSADVTYSEQYAFNWLGHDFEFYHIPGHSAGSGLIMLDGKYAFTGDSLLKDLPIIIRFPGSNKEDYLKITLPFLNRLLRSEMMILPGHGKPFALNEIMDNNQIHVQFR